MAIKIKASTDVNVINLLDLFEIRTSAQEDIPVIQFNLPKRLNHRNTLSEEAIRKLAKNTTKDIKSESDYCGNHAR